MQTLSIPKLHQRCQCLFLALLFLFVALLLLVSALPLLISALLFVPALFASGLFSSGLLGSSGLFALFLVLLLLLRPLLGLFLFLSQLFQSPLQICLCSRFPLGSGWSLPLLGGIFEFLPLLLSLFLSLLCGLISLPHQVLNRQSNHSPFGFERLLVGDSFGRFQYRFFFVRSTPLFGPSVFERSPTVGHVPSVLLSVKHKELSISTHKLHAMA